MLVIFKNVHDLLLKIHVAKNDLTLVVDVRLQPSQTVEGSPSFFSEVRHDQLHDRSDSINEVQHHRVVLEIHRLELFI